MYVIPTSGNDNHVQGEHSNTMKSILHVYEIPFCSYKEGPYISEKSRRNKGIKNPGKSCQS